MKTRYYNFMFVFVAILFFAGCKTSVNNSFTITNNADASVIVTFRANAISVPAGQNTVIQEIPQGTYSYSTAYSKPASATTSTSTGDVTGQIVIKAGTRILLLFTSSTDASGNYLLSATLSSSDDETTPTSP